MRYVTGWNCNRGILTIMSHDRQRIPTRFLESLLKKSELLPDADEQVSFHHLSRSESQPENELGIP